MVVIVKENDNGKIELTKEELEKIIEQAKGEAKPVYIPLWNPIEVYTPFYYQIKERKKPYFEITCYSNETSL